MIGITLSITTTLCVAWFFLEGHIITWSQIRRGEA